MGRPSANETWIIELGGAVIDKKECVGNDKVSPLEMLIYCLWVADYGMRNAGDLETARDLYADFQKEAASLSRNLNLHATHRAFALPEAELEDQYFELFDEICDEIQCKINNKESGNKHEDLRALQKQIISDVMLADLNPGPNNPLANESLGARVEVKIKPEKPWWRFW